MSAAPTEDVDYTMGWRDWGLVGAVAVGALALWAALVAVATWAAGQAVTPALLEAAGPLRPTVAPLFPWVWVLAYGYVFFDLLTPGEP